MTNRKPNFEGDNVELDGVCFDYSNRNHKKNYSQGMRKVAEYFGQRISTGRTYSPPL